MHLSTEVLETIGVELSSIEKTRKKKKQCQLTVKYLIENHKWFLRFLEQYAEKRNPPLGVPPELVQLQYEYANLKDKEEQKPLYLKSYKLQLVIREKYKELHTKNFEYSKILRPHFKYLSNQVDFQQLI